MKNNLIKIIEIILVIVIIVCGYKYYQKQQDYKKSDAIYTELQKQKEENTSTKDDSSSSKKDSKKQKTVDLSNINKDYKCWINIENTNIDYPIVQYKDNDYYLHRDIYGNYLYAGTIFIDCHSDYEKSQNLVIFGHNMKNKTIFSELENFKDKDFFYSNPKITLSDKEKTTEYEVFAVLLVHKDYDYIISDFESDKQYSKYLKKIIKESKFKVENNPTVDDRIITLSTCSYEFKDARTVVFAKEI